MVFSSSHVWMWDLNHKEGWALKNWCFWTVVLKRTLESPLDCKKIKPLNPKGNQSWIFIGRTDAEGETPILWPPDVKNRLIGKDPDAGKDWSQEEKGMTEDEMVGWHHQLNGHAFEQAPGVGDGQGSLSCCSPWVCQGSDMTEWLNWLTQNIILYPMTKKEPQQDSRRTVINSSPVPTRWVTHELEKNHNTEVLPQEWKPWAPWEASQFGGLEMGGGAPREDKWRLKTNGVWLKKFHRIEKNRNSTLGGHTKDLMHTRTQGKKQWHPRRLGQTYLLVLESLLLWWRVAIVHCRYKDTGRGNSSKLLETRKLWMKKLIGKGKHIVNVGQYSQTNVISNPAILRKVQREDIGNAFEIKRPAT